MGRLQPGAIQQGEETARQSPRSSNKADDHHWHGCLTACVRESESRFGFGCFFEASSAKGVERAARSGSGRSGPGATRGKAVGARCWRRQNGENDGSSYRTAPKLKLQQSHTKASCVAVFCRFDGRAWMEGAEVGSDGGRVDGEGLNGVCWGGRGREELCWGGWQRCG